MDFILNGPREWWQERQWVFLEGELSGMRHTGQRQGFHSTDMAGSPAVFPAGRPRSIQVDTVHTGGPLCGVGSPAEAEQDRGKVQQGHSQACGAERRGPFTWQAPVSGSQVSA